MPVRRGLGHELRRVDPAGPRPGGAAPPSNVDPAEDARPVLGPEDRDTARSRARQFRRTAPRPDRATTAGPRRVLEALPLPGSRRESTTPVPLPPRGPQDPGLLRRGPRLVHGSVPGLRRPGPFPGDVAEARALESAALVVGRRAVPSPHGGPSQRYGNSSPAPGDRRLGRGLRVPGTSGP